MNNAISIVISKKIYDSSKLKAFVASLFIHLTLLATLLHFSNHVEFVHLPLESKRVVISLANYAPAIKSHEKSVLPTSKPLKKVKKITHVKKTHKVVQQTKPKPAIKPEIKTPQQVEPAPVLPAEAFTPPVKDAQLPTKQEVTHQKTPIAHSPLTHASASQSHTHSNEISNEELARIRVLIQDSLRYPAIARKLKIEGVVLISFSLSRDGHIDSLSLLKSSGSSALDKRALQTVSLLDGEYPQLSKKVDLKIPISFSLQQS